MSLKDTLQYLMPIELGGAHQADLEHDARMLEAAMRRGETLLAEMFGNSTSALLADWERVYNLLPAGDDPLQARIDQIVMTIRRRGGLSIPYFVSLAAGMGYDIDIEEPIPSMAGWLCAGDELLAAEVIWQWGVRVGGQIIYLFRAGASGAGEGLAWWSGYDELEALFGALKPAHTSVYFNYKEE